MDTFFTPQFVSTVGVPAIICLYTLREVRCSLDKLTAAINKLGEDHTKEISALKDDVKELKFKINTFEIKYSGGVKHNENND